MIYDENDIDISFRCQINYYKLEISQPTITVRCVKIDREMKR